jgi:hypothetical protein
MEGKPTNKVLVFLFAHVLRELKQILHCRLVSPDVSTLPVVY